MENRYLPILHENISLSVLRVSNESLSSWDEWVVKMVFNVNYFLLLDIFKKRETKGTISRVLYPNVVGTMVIYLGP